MTFSTDNNGPSSSSIFSICADNSSIWFGTYGDGISKYERECNRWTTFNTTNSGLIDDYVRDIEHDGTTQTQYGFLQTEG